MDEFIKRPFHKSDAKMYIGFQGAILFYHGKSDQTSGNLSETHKKSDRNLEKLRMN